MCIKRSMTITRGSFIFTHLKSLFLIIILIHTMSFQSLLILQFILSFRLTEPIKFTYLWFNLIFKSNIDFYFILFYNKINFIDIQFKFTSWEQSIHRPSTKNNSQLIGKKTAKIKEEPYGETKKIPPT